MAVTVILIYLLLMIAEVYTKSPYLDEFYVAKPAYNLAFHGFPGTTGLEMTGSNWTGIDKLTYNTLPAGILALAGFYKLFGFSLLTTRFLSILLSLLVLFSMYWILRCLDSDPRRSWLTIALLGFNYSFMLAAGFGRVDMLTAAAGVGAQAIYLYLRAKHLSTALVFSSFLLTVSCLTHPNGLIYLLMCAALILWKDRAKLRLPHAIVFALPLLAGFSGWLIYASHSPEDARRQLLVNAGEHKFLTGLQHPLSSIVFELQERYLHSVFAWNAGPRPPIAVRLKGIVTLSYLGAVIGVLLIPSLRRKSGNQILLIQTTISFFYLCFLEGLKFPWYLLICVPLYSALLSDCALHLWDRRQIPRWTIVSVGIGLIAIHLGGVVYRIVQDPFHKDYLPAVRFLQQRAAPADLIFAKCDFAFGYGFERNVLDDPIFGLKSRRKAHFIVRDQAVDWDLNAWKRTDPAIYQHMIHVLDNYKVVYQLGSYRIYELTEHQVGQAL